MRKRLAIGLGTMLMLNAVADSALAQSTIPGPTVYVGGARSLPIPVTASVGGRCGFADGAAPSGSHDVGLIDRQAWAHQFPFTLNCNGASRVAVTSANGGLRTATSPGDPGYLGLAPYTVTLNLVGAGGANALAQCAVATLAVGAVGSCTFQGAATQDVGLLMSSPSQNLAGSYLQVDAPAYAGPGVLVQGAYADTLTVTVSAAI